MKWRRAFAATVQKEEIVKILDIGSNWGANRGSNLSTETDLKPAHSWIPHGLQGFPPHSYDDTYEHSRTPIQIQQNPDVEWLKHNGTKAYSGNIDVGFDNGARNSKIIEKFQYDINKTFDSFFKNSNIKTTLFHQDWKSYLHTLQTNPPHLYRFAWIAPFMDPITHLQIWTRENANNYSGCFDERYDHLVSEIEKMKPGPQRNKKINEAQRILIKEQAFVVPIYHYVQYTGVSERVGGFHMNQSGIIDLSGLYFYSKQ